MPIYEYRCEDCGQIFEEWQKNFDEKKVNCPVCGHNSERIISNTSFILKGSGWYVTDYCDRKSSSSGNGSSGNGSSGNGNGTSGKKADSNGSSGASKSDAKTPASKSKPAESKPAAKSSGSAQA